VFEWCWSSVGDELHTVARCDGYTAVRQRHPHLFDELGGGCVGWCGPNSSANFMHQDPVKVALSLLECSQRRLENLPYELLFA